MGFSYITPPENFLQVPFRLISTAIVRLIAPTGITPNQVTFLRGGLVLIGLVLMASGIPGTMTLGAVLFYIFEILDHVDGDLARFTNQKTKLGPLLEQFQDTVFARPANLLGFAIALGLYRGSGTWIPLICFAICAYGRMNWMEFRDYFGWQRDIAKTTRTYEPIFAGRSLPGAMLALGKVLYTWNNTFILVPALLFDYLPIGLARIVITTGFALVAILNNLPWIAIVIHGFHKAWRPSRE